MSDTIRTTQIQELLDYCKRFADLPIIITGDFNFVPFDNPYNLIINSFKSSYKEANKREAGLTFPTGLNGEYADIGECGSLDYI